MTIIFQFILNITPTGVTSARFRSGGDLLVRPISHGTQEYQTDKSLYPLNQPVPKYEAMIQSSGEAQFANDIPPLPREVFGAFVLSTIHVGQIDKIDATEVLVSTYFSNFDTKIGLAEPEYNYLFVKVK